MMKQVQVRQTVSRQVIPNMGYDVTTHRNPQRRSVSVGSAFVRLMPPQKGDGIRALPWAWTDTQSMYEDSNFDVKIYNDFNSTSIVMDSRGLPDHDPVLRQITDLQKSRIRSQAILKAQASLRKQVASLPLLFAERKATLKTVHGYSKFILNNVITMQRKDVKKWLAAIKRQSTPQQLKTLANQIANRHLEFVFGVMPILDDISKSIDHFSKPRLDVRTGRGRDRLIIETDRRTESILDRHNISEHIFYVQNVTGRDDYSVRCDLRCEITSHVLNNASLLGFNPIYTWYDLTPLSFIVGWFSNFNTWLQSLDPILGLEYVTGSSSIMSKQSFDRRSSVFAKNSADLNRSASGSGSSSMTHVDFRRVVHERMPEIQGIQIMDKTSLFTYAASVSLAIQRLIGKTERVIRQKPFKYRGHRPRNLPPIKYRKVQS